MAGGEGSEATDAGPDPDTHGRIVGMVRADDARLTRAAAGVVIAKGDVSIDQGGCGPVLANGGVNIHFGGCGPVLANGDVSIVNGGTQAVLAAGGTTIGPKALVGLVLSPEVSVENGGRVLLDARRALAFGAAAGVAFALASRLVRR